MAFLRGKELGPHIDEADALSARQPDWGPSAAGISRPWLRTPVLEEGQWLAHVGAQANPSWRLERSTNGTDWELLPATALKTNNHFELRIAPTPNGRAEFFRIGGDTRH